MFKPIFAYVGLRRPYRFERAIPALLAVLLSLVVIASALWLAAVDELTAGGPRAAYFLYLLALLILVIALARWPRLAVALLVLASVDLVWGMGSHALQRAGHGGASLLPPTVAEPERFQWHDLLQATPLPSLRITSPTGLAISHTSEGTRGSDPAPGTLDRRTVVATFGGSTTYDIGAAEGDTWSDRLAEALGPDGTFVVNHGVPGYTTVEHLIQTAFYQTKFGKPPRCAIYYVGWNDLRNAHIPKLDPAYADFHLPSQVDSLKVRRIGGSHVTISPLLTMLARFASETADTVRYFADPYGHDPVDGRDPALEALYERNIRSISAVNRGRGIATIWVGQLVNRDRLQGDGRYGWLPLVRDRDVWPLLQHFNAILERTARALGDTYVAVPPDSFTGADFVDQGHFSAQGSRRFAAYLAPAVREACR
ncbi:MAG: GDSL-type esterase/lipase family protein [Reyranella sp.]|nr:GDSL-type esterase/lipase family protein [Reyranella sp.]MDP3160723.1 GDSL-type esterase/lipase family protein [Reyranella sp.]